MEFHGKSDNVVITDKFPFDDKEMAENITITPNYPSLSNRFEDNKFVAYAESAIISPSFEYQIPKNVKYADFVMAVVKYETKKSKPQFFRTKKENMPKSKEYINEFGFKMYRYKSDDGRIKYFCDNLNFTIEEAKKRWNLGFPLVFFKEGSTENPKTYFPSKIDDKPNLLLIILTNISNMDFERISSFNYDDVKAFLTPNGICQYHNLITLNRLLGEKPDFLKRKYNGFLIHNKQNLQSLLLNPPPHFGKKVSKWKALAKIVKMIKEHVSMQ